MSGFEGNLLVAAAFVAVSHTALGPDHTVPFVVLARARGWSRTRTLVVTLACGAGHVGASLLLGGLGLLLGYGVGHLAFVEEARGDLAAWGLVAFGVAYGAWGLRKAVCRQAGLVPHEHGEVVHLHPRGDRPHDHASEERARTAFWTLFLVFVLGPCEPLIPLFVLPASRGAWGLAGATAATFALFTLATMAAAVLCGLAGIERLPLARLERYSHALAGAAIAGCGLAVALLGL
jgi:hypothetical protein